MLLSTPPKNTNTPSEDVFCHTTTLSTQQVLLFEVLLGGVRWSESVAGLGTASHQKVRWPSSSFFVPFWHRLDLLPLGSAGG